MRKFLIFSALFWLISCSGSADRPKNLVSKQKMSEVLADIAIMQSTVYNQPNNDPEASLNFILKKHGTNKKDFNESYTYYLVNNKLPKIAENAQEIILDKDEGAKKFIEKTQKQNQLQPNLK